MPSVFIVEEVVTATITTTKK